MEINYAELYLNDASSVLKIYESSNFYSEILEDSFYPAIEGFGSKLKDFGRMVKDFFSNLIQGIKNFFTKIFKKDDVILNNEIVNFSSAKCEEFESLLRIMIDSTLKSITIFDIEDRFGYDKYDKEFDNANERLKDAIEDYKKKVETLALTKTEEKYYKKINKSRLNYIDQFGTKQENKVLDIMRALDFLEKREDIEIKKYRVKVTTILNQVKAIEVAFMRAIQSAKYKAEGVQLERGMQVELEIE